MKKTFPLHVAGKDDARVVEAIKRDVRRYVKRERAKALPAETTRWTFECRVGPNESAAEAVPLKDVSRAIDAAATAGSPAVFVEIQARAAAGGPSRNETSSDGRGRDDDAV